MIITSITIAIVAHHGLTLSHESCAIALKNALTTPTTAAQLAPAITAKPAQIWSTPQIRKNQPHASRFANSSWLTRYFEPEIAAIPSITLKKPTRISMIPAKPSHPAPGIARAYMSSLACDIEHPPFGLPVSVVRSPRPLTCDGGCGRH